MLLRESGSSFIDALTLARLRAAYLRQLAETLSPIFDPLGVVETLLRPFSPLFPTAHGSVSLVDWDRQTVGQVWPFGEASPVLAVVPGHALHPEHPWWAAAGSGQALFTPRGQDLSALPDAGAAEAPPAPFALALVPLPGRQRAHGMLTLEVPGEHTFDADEQTFLLSLVGLAGQALDRALLTARQQDLQEALEERNIELRGYTFALSHNLGEPVQRIWNFLKLVEGWQGAQLDDRTRRLFALTRMEAERIAERVDELRSLTLIERQALRPETLDLNVLLVEVRHDLEPLTRERKVGWDVQPLPKIQGDALLMWQALMELLAFAIEDTWEAEQPTIRVEAEEVDGEVVLCLQGNGRGFAHELEERIFEVLDHSVPRKTAFGRLGLSNVRRALGRQGGWVRAEGRPGEGVRFSVGLPRAEEASTVVERLETSGARLGGRTRAPGRLPHLSTAPHSNFPDPGSRNRDIPGTTDMPPSPSTWCAGTARGAVWDPPHRPCCLMRPCTPSSRRAGIGAQGRSKSETSSGKVVLLVLDTPIKFP